MLRSYMENFKIFKKDDKAIFRAFYNTTHFNSLLWVMPQKIAAKFEIQWSRVHRALVSCDIYAGRIEEERIMLPQVNFCIYIFSYQIRQYSVPEGLSESRQKSKIEVSI